MLNLAEYRQRPALLADWLPWAGLVAPGVVLNKDGSFQRTARFRGPDLDSATQGELIATSARLNNALRRWVRAGRCSSRPSAAPPPTIRTRSFPSRCRGWWTRNAAPPSRNRAITSRAAIT
jgi:hypothetical protein